MIFAPTRGRKRVSPIRGPLNHAEEGLTEVDSLGHIDIYSTDWSMLRYLYRKQSMYDSPSVDRLTNRAPRNAWNPLSPVHMPILFVSPPLKTPAQQRQW